MGSCRCKMCGGHIHYEADASVATCEFCGTEQTIVKSDDAKKVNLFNRANALRLQNEFDKAQITYDNILIDEPNNAEAHWGICLCRYGIEYVTMNNKKVPTCHRTAIKSIFDDLDYQETINNADVVAKVVYEKEAKVIDDIQKNILSISQKEEPYDIFISYKGHDETNNRTVDSIKGEEIYNGLTKKGYRVFYSRIALKDKDVSMFEPIIFAALMSSKVMLSIGSKVEYYNSIWEKNEWSRFMSMMKEDHRKYLIPCYIGMNVKELPNDFLMFQAQDISQNNYEELYKRIDKLFTTSEKVVVTKEQVEVREQVVNKLNVENTIGRIGLFLADGKFGMVNDLVEKVLNIDYKCALAYYYKMLASFGCKNENELVQKQIVLDNDPNYEKAMMFADSDLKKKIDDTNNFVKEEIRRKEKEALIKKINSLISNKKYSEAISSFEELYKYDANSEINEFKESIYQIAIKKENEKSYNDAISIFSLLNDYRDSKAHIDDINYQLRIIDECKKCDKLVESINAQINHVLNTRVYDEKVFKSINDKLLELRELSLCSYSMEKHEALKKKLKQLEEQRDKDKSINKKVVLFLLGITVVSVTLIFLYIFVFSKK